MRILFFGSTDGTACALHYFTALSRLGHEVIPFDPRYFASANPVERLAVRANRGPLMTRRLAVALQLEALCRQNRFDAVFVLAENFLGRDAIEMARRAAAAPPHFIYHSHDNNFSSGILRPKDFFEALASYDTVFTTKSQNVARYREIGQERAFYVPSAYEPTVHHPVSVGYSRYPEGFPVSFVGTFARSRLPSLEAVGWNQLHVWGSDWKRWGDWRLHLDRVTPRPIYYFELADVLSRSQLSLGLLREEAEDRHTQRTFEIPACGTLQVAPRNDEILSFFEEDKEIVCFGSLDELREKVAWYLNHEKDRARLAKKGYERCLAGGHRYVDRCETMLGIAFPVATTRKRKAR